MNLGYHQLGLLFSNAVKLVSHLLGDLRTREQDQMLAPNFDRDSIRSHKYIQRDLQSCDLILDKKHEFARFHLSI